MGAIVGVDALVLMSEDNGTTWIPLPERNEFSINIKVDTAEHKVFVTSLAEAWSDSEGAYDLSLDEYGPGRHAVTARAVDALGRWAGASMVVACVGLEEAEEAPAERPALTPPCAEPSRGARTTPTSRAGR